MATALMGIDKTLRTLAWSELTLPQLEYMVRRVAKGRLCNLIWDGETITQGEGIMLDPESPRGKRLIISDDTLSPLATRDEWYSDRLKWISRVLDWIPDRKGMAVFPWAAPFFAETKTPGQWNDLTSDFMSEIYTKFESEKSAKKWKGGKSRREVRAWVMDAKKYEVLLNDASNDYRWKKRKELRAASKCLHAAYLVCLGELGALPKFDAVTRKHVREKDLGKISEIIKRSKEVESGQWAKFEAKSKELESTLSKLEAEVVGARHKLEKSRRILRKKPRSGKNGG